MTQLSVFGTVQARAVAVLLSIREARGDAQVLVALRGASETFPGVRLGAPPVDPLPQRGRVFVETLAEVGFAEQVDDGVVDGGGLGEHGGDGERIRRDPGGVSEGSPHRHNRVRAPGAEEPDTNGY